MRFSVSVRSIKYVISMIFYECVSFHAFIFGHKLGAQMGLDDNQWFSRYWFIAWYCLLHYILCALTLVFHSRIFYILLKFEVVLLQRLVVLSISFQIYMVPTSSCGSAIYNVFHAVCAQ